MPPEDCFYVLIAIPRSEKGICNLFALHSDRMASIGATQTRIQQFAGFLLCFIRIPVFAFRNTDQTGIALQLFKPNQ